MTDGGVDRTVQLHALFDDCENLSVCGREDSDLQTVEWVHQRIAGDGGCGTTGSCRGSATPPKQ